MNRGSLPAWGPPPFTTVYTRLLATALYSCITKRAVIRPGDGGNVNRRNFLALSGMTAADLAWASSPLARAAARTKSDFSLRISPVKLELAPGAMIETVGYNGTAPGPILRMREGKRVTVEVHNDTGLDELVHWHGQFVPSDVDGAMEEGTPMVPAHGAASSASRRVRPARAGTTPTQ